MFPNAHDAIQDRRGGREGYTDGFGCVCVCVSSRSLKQNSRRVLHRYTAPAAASTPGENSAKPVLDAVVGV